MFLKLLSRDVDIFLQIRCSFRHLYNGLSRYSKFYNSASWSCKTTQFNSLHGASLVQLPVTSRQPRERAGNWSHGYKVGLRTHVNQRPLIYNLNQRYLDLKCIQDGRQQIRDKNCVIPSAWVWSTFTAFLIQGLVNHIHLTTSTTTTTLYSSSSSSSSSSFSGNWRFMGCVSTGFFQTPPATSVSSVNWRNSVLTVRSHYSSLSSVSSL